MTLSVRIDWDRDGYSTGVYDDVSAYARGSITCDYGRDQSTALAPVISGRGQLTLDNTSRRFTPRNTAGPLYGKLVPNRPVLIQRSITSTVTNTYTIFAAHTDDAPLNPDPNSKVVQLSLVDSIADFRGVTLSTAVSKGIRTGDAISLILDEVGWAGGRDIDPGATFMPWWWAENVDALTALQDLVSAEGSPAILTVGSSGEIVFRDRHHRLRNAASLTSQATWRGVERVEPMMTTGFTIDEAWRNVINACNVQVDERAPGLANDVVWSSTDQFTISDGETVELQATTSDPFTDAATPDVTTLSGVVNVFLVRDSGASATIRLTATGGPAVVSSVSLRATPIPVLKSRRVFASHPTSAAAYGKRGYPAQLAWGTVANIQDLLNLAVAMRYQPLPIVSARFQIGSAAPAARANAVLGRNIGDRVTIVEPETGLSNDFYIESISHQINGEVDHVVTFGCEMAPAIETSVFRFDVSGRGFDDGRFGAGLDDPATILQFDGTAGHRFDEAMFAS